GLHGSARVPRRGADAVFGFRESEEEHGAHAGVEGALRFFDGFADAQLEDAGHGADLDARARGRDDEERVDEVFRPHDGLAYERADAFAAAQPPRTPHELSRRR